MAVGPGSSKLNGGRKRRHRRLKSVYYTPGTRHELGKPRRAERRRGVEKSVLIRSAGLKEKNYRGHIVNSVAFNKRKKRKQGTLRSFV